MSRKKNSTADTTAPKPARRRPNGILAILLLLVGVALCVNTFLLVPARYATQIREATLPELQALLVKDPANPRLISLFAARLASAGDYALAAEAFSRAAEANETDPQVYLAWAASEAATGQGKRAFAALQFGIKRHPEIAPQLQAAIDRVSKLVKKATPVSLAETVCPGGVEPIIAERTKGSFLNGYVESQGRREPLKSGYATREKLAKERPQDPLIQRLWGEALLANRRFPEAEKTLRQALALDSKSPETNYALGKTLEEQGNLAEAGLLYIAALKARPDWLPALLAAGNVAVEKQLIAVGIDAFERAVKQDPNSAEAWIGYGRAYYNQKLRLDKALEGFDKAHKLDPKRTDFYGDYSNALRSNFRMEEAEAVLRQRVKEAPMEARTRYLFALILLDNKPTPEREAEAETQLRESLKIEPRVSATQARLGRLLLSRGNARDAIRYLEEALRLDEYNVNATLSLALAYNKTGNKKDAERVQKSAKALSDYVQRTTYLEDQINRNPTDRKMHLEVAKLYEQGKETEKAKTHYDMAYMLLTHPKEARRGVTALRNGTSISH